MDTLHRLIQALRYLPGLGPKSAERMAYQLLRHPKQRQRGLHLAQVLRDAMENIRHCARCNHYTEKTYCALCDNTQRDRHLLCIVETPADVHALEQSQTYHGLYYILMGHLSPLDNIGPNDIALEGLYQLVRQEPIKEIILALSPSLEGRTTALFIRQQLQTYPLTFSQLAQGIPSSGALEFLDAETIRHAFHYRHTV